MKRASLLTILVSFASLAVQSAVAQTAQPSATASVAPAPRTPDGHPDLSGVWWPGSDLRVPPLDAAPPAPRTANAAPPAPRPPNGPPPGPPVRRTSFASLYQPWAMEKARTLGDKDDPALRCVPVAFGTVNVSLYGLGFVGQIVQTPTLVVMLTETYHSFKIIPTDGRKHRDDVPPSFRGDSVGRWEGDTLVVDTTNFADTNWMSAEGNVSFHSDALHTVERYRRVDRNSLEVEATVEDPKVLTGPWTTPKIALKRAPIRKLEDEGHCIPEGIDYQAAGSK
jgi:hypothetical protein